MTVKFEENQKTSGAVVWSHIPCLAFKWLLQIYSVCCGTFIPLPSYAWLHRLFSSFPAEKTGFLSILKYLRRCYLFKDAQRELIFMQVKTNGLELKKSQKTTPIEVSYNSV